MALVPRKRLVIRSESAQQLFEEKHQISEMSQDGQLAVSEGLHPLFVLPHRFIYARMRTDDLPTFPVPVILRRSTHVVRRKRGKRLTPKKKCRSPTYQVYRVHGVVIVRGERHYIVSWENYNWFNSLSIIALCDFASFQLQRRVLEATSALAPIPTYWSSKHYWDTGNLDDQLAVFVQWCFSLFQSEMRSIDLETMENRAFSLFEIHSIPVSVQ